jgi:hypothetical protein
VNEKTAENPRSWPLISGHLAPQGRRFAGFSLFFQSGKAHRSRMVFWYFSTRKSTKQTSIHALDQFPGVQSHKSSRVSQQLSPRQPKERVSQIKNHKSKITNHPASASQRPKAKSQQLTTYNLQFTKK